jgi:hypothetical protein
MAEHARFHFVVGRRLRGVLSPAWAVVARSAADPAEDGAWYAWRLLGRNNRELGRSSTVHPSADACVDSLGVLRTRISDLVPMLVVDVDTGLWGWRLALDGKPVVVAPRTYHRQREGHYSVGQFLLLAASARVGDPRGSVPLRRRVPLSASRGPVVIPLDAFPRRSDPVRPWSGDLRGGVRISPS